MLEDKKVLLGVCGGIAAYKSAYIVRLLVREKVHVKVIMTESALNFITPLTLSTLSKNPVYYKFFDENTGLWNSHVDLAEWADYMIIAPATANTLAKMVNGQSDNLLIATYLSSDIPVFVAPAMDLNMYKHSATRQNLRFLEDRGDIILNADDGELASGLCGEGRMAEPEDIVFQIGQYIKKGRIDK
jgi:phosphopantothenoylcysteine decarboxylase / phosphopantothenate---cysteine ligase